jgi:putative CRISPR-associated protein (TIGR02619 family)
VKKVITTVGTSLFTNYNEKNKTTLNAGIQNELYSEYVEWQDEIDEIKEKLIPFAKNDNSCAELTSIMKLKEKYGEIEVYLIATDTIESVVVCEVLEEVLMEKDIEVKFDDTNIIAGLQVDDYIKFKEGLLHLIQKLYQISEYYYENIVLNITGGYKAIIPYLTIFGQVNNTPLYYIFENSNELISIPQAPINVDWSLFQKYKNIVDALSEIPQIDRWEVYKRENSIEDDFPDIIEFIEIDNKQHVTLNAIGEIFYEKFKNYIIIEVLKGANFSKENAGNRLEIEKAIKELHQRLQEYVKQNSISTTNDLISNIKKLSDQDDLKHGGNLEKDSFIFKSTNIGQIRLVYSPMLIHGEIVLKIIFYERGAFNHSTYIDDLKNKMRLLTDMEFISYPIKK